jgi:predicted dehydrogenase
MKNSKLGIALVGLGTYSTEELAPALKETQHCYLAGIVSGSPEKCEKWKSEHHLKDQNIYDYTNFDEIRNNDDIDIVYVVLPNSMHAEFAIRAARAGKHVICEKPLATTVEDCHRMIDACRSAAVKLSVGYRLHFEPFNQEMMRLGQQQVFGPVRNVVAKDSMDIGDPNQWRLDKSLAGGGPLMNNGVYCVQGTLFITGELPVAVTAKFSPVTNPEKFMSVEEGITWEMEFESGIEALCGSSYSKNENLLRAEAERGWFELEPAYEYKGLKGNTSNGRMKFPAINQQAAQMDDFALCIKNNQETRVPGEMGLRDVEIMLAIYEAAKTGRKVQLHLEAFANLAEM